MYPEGSHSKRVYDSVFMAFSDFLIKYYKDPDLRRWHYCFNKFVLPLVNNDPTYREFLKQVKPPFLPDKEKFDAFCLNNVNDNKFPIDIIQFFSFLYAIDFFKNMSYIEWLNSPDWQHPWFKENDSGNRNIMEIISHKYGENYLRVRLAELSIF